MERKVIRPNQGPGWSGFIRKKRGIGGGFFRIRYQKHGAIFKSWPVRRKPVTPNLAKFIKQRRQAIQNIKRYSSQVSRPHPVYVVGSRDKRPH